VDRGKKLKPDTVGERNGARGLMERRLELGSGVSQPEDESVALQGHLSFLINQHGTYGAQRIHKSMEG